MTTTDNVFQDPNSLVAEENARMLRDSPPTVFTEVDQLVFDTLVAPDHFLRRAQARIDFEQFRPLLSAGYSPDQGRPADNPVRMFKLIYLGYHANLSDRQVIEHATTDMAYRWFLQLSLSDDLPDPSSLSYFRGRLGVDGFQSVFQQLVAQAREHGLVRDRLRLKDATHVIANVALPTTLALTAQMRDKLLAAAEPFDALRVTGERANIAVQRDLTAGCSPEVRLIARVTQLRELLAWVDQLPAPDDAQDGAWQHLIAMRQLAHKVLADQEHPQEGDKTRSTVDPDARRSRHGDWYDGYLLDVMMDADSELITAINVLPANGDEAADAAELIRQEETAQGNDIEALSIDGIGFQGPVLRELEDPQGLDVDVYVPPKQEPANELFTPQDFVEDPQHSAVTCPAGQTSRYRSEEARGRIYRFAKVTCAACPLSSRCIGNPSKGHFGRSVRKNDFEAEYQRARDKAQTDAYQEVRSQHPAIERKLSELVRRHGARRARFRGQHKTLCQQLITAVVVNVKRMVHLLGARESGPVAE